MIASSRILLLVDRAPVMLAALLLGGTALAFGGAVWWAGPAIATATLLLVLAAALRATARRSWHLILSPLAPVGLLALGLAALQLVPLPAALAGRLSPHAQALHTRGVLPELARADDPEARLPEALGSRTPASVDRPATLRWLLGAAACLAVFCVVAHDADRLDRTVWIWGSVVAPLFVFTGFGVVQLVGGVEGLYGWFEPGKAPAWAPSTADLLTTPGMRVMKRLEHPSGADSAWVVPDPGPVAAVGGLMGGPGAYLALGSLALPLALGLCLQCVAPRGSREPLRERLGYTNRGGVALMLLVLTVLSAGLTGVLAGPVLCLPFAAGLILAGLPGARAAGMGGLALGATVLVLAALGGGVLLGATLGRPPGVSPLSDPSGWPAVRAVWAETARIAGDFPLVGSGMGSFPAVHPYYKSSNLTMTTAWSTLLRFWSEAGVAGVALVGLAGAWCLARLPGAIQRVGTADRVLGYSLVGAVVAFATFSVIHWTTELAAVALAASAVAGTFDRWLAGGTDLFVERS
jgi:hypothetical protein